ncbi:formate dehydrogenase accessory sulfurtransferase FdhD [Virgibacillus dakarensis]|uniref:Sulfur carrier protein FdhD n=1 Tax=Lentibacillus populi TaxID=1827502 RepID=A0A9W5TXT5_9BACI|nr:MULTISPECIES: formate dehydrogenase accessory sulfurtransferase FdhD [Bacillaceae]MBT2215398.1 formate dehydrogenase accessory sulfurtransferase FdhD [Virgibacillus dakarensis]MTW85433.1 formate dehydrogenase accessory sulfurtransferase FdhD [Virgibacillus dakarensis]GGB39866.1 sulfurtransferase FdhD [Lentibacillus populi]
MDKNSTTLWKTTKYHHHLQTIEEDEIARESAMTIVINGTQYATIVCTPNHLEELVIGFLASEGIIRSIGQMRALTIDDVAGFAYVELVNTIEFTERTERWIGSCCGKSREFYLKQDVKTAKTITTRITISTDQALDLMKQFDYIAEAFDRTGGVHQAALAAGNGIISSFIDIGRHNALDKLYGFILQNKLSMKDKCILFSGRISSEVVLKVSKMGGGILLAKSAPTDLALKLADDLHITAVGFVRKNKLNVYTHDSRIYGDVQRNLYFSK